MTEAFLQFIWKNKLFEQKTYLANTGEEVQIIHTGEQNFDAGPDFQFVKIHMNKTLWVGNCEIHINASDWVKHHHNHDKSYENIILHIVKKNDIPIKNKNGQLIPTIELSYDPQFEDKYQELLSSTKWIACMPAPSLMERFYISQWLTNLAIERFNKRYEEIALHLEKSKQDWEETFYHFLAKGFGFKVNATPFELLAKSMPLTILSKHKNSKKQIEALLFGQAGLLQNKVNDPYTQELLSEYQFLQKKYGLQPISTSLWKFLRLRPVNFPTIRIAQFAALIYKSSALFSKILEHESVEELKKLLMCETSSYWDNHYKFGTISVDKPKPLANASMELLIVNTIIPFIFAYGKQKSSPGYIDKAINLLEELKPEKNNIIENWKKIGLEPRNMLESQALLQLKNEYCNKQACLNCFVGRNVICDNF